MVRSLDLSKKKAILKAAKAIFIKDGYTAAKMSDIALEAGVAPGTLYIYFENKDALAGAIGEEFFSRLIAQLKSIIQKIKGPDGIVTLVDWALQIAQQERAILAMVKERNKDLKSKIEERKRLVTQLAEALSNLVSRGIIRPYTDTTTLASLLMALVRRIIMSKAIFQDENTDELKAGAIKILQHILFDDVTLMASRLIKRK